MTNVSKSSIERYLSCPAKFWRERLAPPADRRQEPTTGPLIAGRAAHTVIETLIRAMRSAKRSGLDGPDTQNRQRENVPRLYEKAFTAEVIACPDADWGDRGRQDHYDGGLAATRALVADALGQPISAEEVPFSVELAPGLRLTGRIDAILANGALVDFKTQTASRFSPWRWTHEKAQHDLQPAVYALGMIRERGVLPASFTFRVAEKTPGAHVETFPVPLTHAHAAVAHVIALTVAKAIERGVFPMPGGHACKFCFLKAQGGCR